MVTLSVPHTYNGTPGTCHAWNLVRLEHAMLGIWHAWNMPCLEYGTLGTCRAWNMARSEHGTPGIRHACNIVQYIRLEHGTLIEYR